MGAPGGGAVAVTSEQASAQSAITNSRWGLRGSEDLGGGLKAIFDLESGINLQDGSASDSRRIFNRNAYVGVSSPYGTLTLGRQKTPLFDLLGDTYDPLTVGNYTENSWLLGALGAGLYADNAIRYTGTFKGLTVAAMYSFGTNSESTGGGGFSGQVPGHLGAGNMYGLTLSYMAGPLSDMSNAAIGAGQLGSGYRYTFVALAEYALSKRTEVYGTVDFDKVSGAATVELPGRDNQTGVALGLRTVF
ncbi:porin [Paraburkholderia sp. RAU6.4a]|uniref:porin n=1 Tax=Paraburkholderia sp. RAU6.4a TaxID=2991067 RepID=UPI003D21017D